MKVRGVNEMDKTPLPDIGSVRLAQFVAKGKAIPVSTGTWWAGVKSGRFPQPVKLGPNTTAWNVQDIRALISELAGQEQASA